MNWNYRVMRLVDGDGDVYMAVQEVYYEDSKPTGYFDASLQWNVGEDPLDTIAKMVKAFDQPVLTPEDFK